MLPAARTTLILAGVLVALVAGDAAVRMMGTPDIIEMPSLPDVNIAETNRIRIARQEETVVLERVGDTANWRMVSPTDAPADRQAVQQLLLRLAQPVRMQVKLEDGNLKQYGLAPGNAIRVEFFEEGDEPAVDFFVGHSTVGGANFIRLPNDEAVYRAQVGGRHRYDKPAREWRDPTVFPFEEGGVSGFDIAVKKVDPDTKQISDEVDYRLPFRKTNGDWSLASNPDFDVDNELLQQVIGRLGSMRAGRVLPGDFPVPEPWIMQATVHRDGLDSVGMSFYVDGKLAYIKRDGRNEVFQVAPSSVQKLALPPHAWANRQLLNLDRPQIHQMTLHLNGEGDFVLQQDAGNSTWTVIKPANVDANLRESMQAAIKLSQLRVSVVVPRPPVELGFPSKNWIELTMLDGSTHRLEIGKRDNSGRSPVVFVRNAAEPDRIGPVPLRFILELRQAWSK